MEIGVGPVAASFPEGGEAARSSDLTVGEVMTLFCNRIAVLPPKRYRLGPMEMGGVSLGRECSSPKSDWLEIFKRYKNRPESMSVFVYQKARLREGRAFVAGRRQKVTVSGCSPEKATCCIVSRRVMSSSSSVRPKASRLDFMCSASSAFTTGMKPCCRLQRRAMRAGETPYFSPSSMRSGWCVRPPRPSGLQA